jgi:autotransporter-associated beta strand protein
LDISRVAAHDSIFTHQDLTMKLKIPFSRLRKNSRFACAIVGLAMVLPVPAGASLLVYEGFNYTGQVDNAPINSAAFSGGIGLSDAWAGAGKYRVDGLSFSDFPVAGGSVENANAEIFYRKLSVGQTGTVWGSFLFKSISAVDTSTNLLDLVISKKANGTDYQAETSFGVAPKRYQGTGGDIRLGGATPLPTPFSNVGGAPVVQGVTYLVLFKVENLVASGGTATSQTISSWILSAAQYDNFKSGELTEAELNASSQGAGPTNVMQKTTLTATQQATFSANDYLTIQSNNVGNYVNDEIRFSNASLAEVAPSGAPSAEIYAFGSGATVGSITANAAAISWIVPFGSNVATLAPTYTLSAGATCNLASGSAQNFSSPVHYIVQSSDFSTTGKTTDYTVTVTVASSETTLVWNAVDGVWDTNVANWKERTSGAISNFFNGKNAIFDKPAGGAISIAAGVLAASTTVSAASGNYTFQGVLAGAGGLTKSNGGTLTLEGTNTYTGGTVINAGTVACSLSNPSPLGGAGSVNVTLQSGATLAFNRNQITGTLVSNGGRIATGNGWGDDAWNGPMILSATTTVDVGFTDGSFLMNGVVSGPGGLIKLGGTSKPMPLNGENTFTGPVSVQAGAIRVASLNRVVGGTATSNLGAPTTVANGTISLGAANTDANFVYTGPGETTDRVIRLAGSTGNGTISQSGTSIGIPSSRGELGLLKFTSDISVPGVAGVGNQKTLILTQLENENIGTNPGSGEISGNIGDSVLGTVGQLATSVTKSGSRTWTLSGANTYTGATKVQLGTLAFSQANSLGSGSLDISTGAKVQLNYIGTRQISALTFNAGSVLPNGTYGSTSSLAATKDDTRFSGPGTVTVGPISFATTTTLARTGGAEPSNGGTPVTFTATVVGNAPTGNVMFYDGLNLIGTSALDSSFRATVTTNGLSSGAHSISALYSGNPTNASSTGNITQTVLESRTLVTTTTLALSSGTNPSAYTAPLTFTATVTGSTPGGNVLFYNGPNLLGTATLNSAGKAALTVSGLAAGWRPISARYLGDSTHLPSAPASVLFQTINPPAGNGKLKIFILAGQSNMQGKASAEIGRDPSNFANTNLAGGLGSLRNMVNKNPNKYGYLTDATNPIANGNPGWITRSDVGVTYWSDPGAGENRRGNLDANFGDTGAQGRIGPEYSFGLVVGSQLGDNVLLIKYAFGGKSLAVDYRSPGAVAARGGSVGPYYTEMVARVNQVLANISTYYPAYTGGGYEIAGFAWHQGFNDRINNAYTAEYEANMTNLIKDLRTTLGVPNLPVVIADTGMGNAPTGPGSLVAGQGNVGDPTKHPEFTGTVTTVKTTQFDYGNLQGASNEGYHWNWNAQSYFNIGESMGNAMMALLPSKSSAKEITNFVFPGLPTATISGNSINLTVPYGTNVTALAPTFTLSALATASPPSGSQRDFSTPQSYVVTAEDTSFLTYTVTVTAGSTAYISWASNLAQGLVVGQNDGALADPDGDGITNILEFVLGGSPSISSQSILPTLKKSASDWVFEYSRSDLSLPPATTQIVEYGSDLMGWTPVEIPATSSQPVVIVEGTPSGTVKVTLPNLGSKAFVRLKVSQ